MTTDPGTNGEDAIKAEIYPNVAAIASVYGDPNGKYVKFLSATGFPYADDATFLWDQPLTGGDSSGASGGSGTGPGGTTGANGERPLRIQAVERICFFAFVLLALGLEF
jgi:hypothetical protein